MADREGDYRYELKQRLNKAVRYLREAEDMARIEQPAWPTADRIRTIYEQVSEDILNGRTTVPPIAQRLRECEAVAQGLRDAGERLSDALAVFIGLLHTNPTYAEAVEQADIARIEWVSALSQPPESKEE
jgi:hypothetical protein